MFEDRYRQAYDAITPSQELVSDTIRKAKKDMRSGQAFKKRFAQKASLAAAAAVLCLVMAVPVCAAHVPVFYKIVEYISPALADHLVPVEESSTDQGITMQVEAINLEGNEAGIIISLRDADGSTQDLVHGEMDLFDSYSLSDYMNDSNVGGCQFLTYDEEEDKAYFQVNVRSDRAYRSGKLRFTVHSVLCNKFSREQDVDLSGIVYDAKTKRVSLSGGGGLLSEDMLPDSLKRDEGTPEDPTLGSRHVLDVSKTADCAADDFTLTGIAYMDGVLRVQMCMGDNRSADRHVELFLKDADGNERYPDRSVSWHETAGDNNYCFYEFWYVEDIDDIADYAMYGIFHDSGELIKGDWSVTFRLHGD